MKINFTGRRLGKYDYFWRGGSGESNSRRVVPFLIFEFSFLRVDETRTINEKSSSKRNNFLRVYSNIISGTTYSLAGRGSMGAELLENLFSI